MSDYSAVAPPQNFNQSSAFAAALQRAKQIAAKINPATTGQKRPHEEGGPEPDSKKIASLDSGPPGFGGPNRAMSPPQGQGGISAAAAQAAAQAAAVAARVAAAQSGVPQHGGLGGGGGPVHTEDIRVPDKMVGLIIGRGGEQITRLQSESGCKIQMAADSNGQPDRVCSLAGPRDAIQRAKDMIFSIVHTHQRGGRHEPPSQNAPGDVGGGNFGGGGGGGGGGMSHVEIMVPGPKVGLIIGKGGETIKQLQEKSGAKMVVIQDGPNPEQEKPLRISGDPQKVEYAKQLVYDLIAEKEMQAYTRGSGGGGGGGRGGRGGPGGEDHRGGNREGGYGNQGGYNGGNQGGNQDYGPPGTGNNQDGVEVQVPRAAVGVVIGKGGDMIKKIQAETGARVQFQQGRDDGPGDRRCLLTGKPQNVDAARQRIEELIDSVHRRDNEGGQNNNRGGNNRRGNNYDQRNSQGGNGGYGGPPGGNWGPGPQGGHGGPNNPQQLEVTFQVPTYKCGVIIGRGGETIKQINQQSGAHCELDRKAAGNGQEKTFIIRGDPESVENAKMIISEKIQLPIYFTPVNGAPNQPPQPNAPNMNAAMPTAYPGMAPQAYTPQGWGANTGYQQQWPQPGQQSDPNAAAPAQVQINPQTGQPDYSKQWAEYYRSLGMHREADMIEQQAKGGQPGVQPGMPGQPTAQNPPGVPNAPGTQPVLLTPYAGAAQNQIPQQQQPIPGANPVATSNAATNGSTATLSTGASGGAGGGAGQPDYSAQWAEYYRSIGKVKEAEAIEAQMKNKGPGGSSQPSGGQPGAAQPGSAAGQPGVMGVQTGAPQAAPLGGMAATGAPIAAPGQFPAYGGYQAAGYYPTQQAANPAAPQGSYNFPAYGAYGQPQTTTPDN